MRLLVIEDDKDLNRQLVAALEQAGYAVDTAFDGEEGHFLGETEPYDAIVLDIGLPKKDGITVLEEWRAAGRKTPVLMLTARDRWSDKVEGFDAGADDYVAKPFHMEEVLARLRALVRRAAGHASPRIACGALTFEAQTGVFELDGLPLKLTALEWRVLECLIMRKDVVVDRTELSEKVYEGDAGTDSNSLEVIVARLRRKIGKDAIETVRGRGYRLVDQGSA